MWVYIASLLTTRVLVLAQGVGLVVKRTGQLKPSVMAKVCGQVTGVGCARLPYTQPVLLQVWLVLALLLSGGEDLPSFAFTHNLPSGCGSR